MTSGGYFHQLIRPFLSPSRISRGVFCSYSYLCFILWHIFQKVFFFSERKWFYRKAILSTFLSKKKTPKNFYVPIKDVLMNSSQRSKNPICFVDGKKSQLHPGCSGNSWICQNCCNSEIVIPQIHWFSHNRGWNWLTTNCKSVLYVH